MLASLLIVTSACATAPVTSVVDQLYFGTSIPSGGHVSDDDWRAFVKDVITPMFKEGLTVIDGDGQWLDQRGTLWREHVHIVEVAHKPGAEADAAIEAIANEYKKRFNQDAVLRITAPVTLKLY